MQEQQQNIGSSDTNLQPSSQHVRVSTAAAKIGHGYCSKQKCTQSQVSAKDQADVHISTARASRRNKVRMVPNVNLYRKNTVRARLLAKLKMKQAKKQQA